MKLNRKNSERMKIGLVLLIALTIFNLLLIFSIIGLLNNAPLIQPRVVSDLSNESVLLSPNESRNVSVPIVAVSENGEGIVSYLSVSLIKGDNKTLITTSPFSEPDIQFSIQKAALVARDLTGYSNQGGDLIFDFESDRVQLIGGESAGAAMTAATVALFQNKTLRNDFVMTGTIEFDGDVGKVGAVLEKAEAVAEAGFDKFIIPEGQAEVTYYERVLDRRGFGGLIISGVRYVPRKVNLTEIAMKEWNLTIIEVSNINESLNYLFEGGV